MKLLSRSKALRAALACGASALALAFSATAVAQQAQPAQREESSVYLLRYAREIADGNAVISQSKDLMMARHRVGDRSMLVFDTQNGVASIERGGRTAVLPLISKRGPEASYAFDYANKIAFGSGVAGPRFNVTVRPLLAFSPELGADARWSVETTLLSLAVATRGDTKVKFNVSRTYLQNDGKPVVLIEFEVPAFTYTASDGSTIVHWARGMAVTDPGFGEIHALATQHRASVREADGGMRPISVRTTMHGIDRAGGWRMSFRNAPQIQAAMARLTETLGDTPDLPSTRRSSADLPLLVAMRLDAAAFGVAENSANGVNLALAAGNENDALTEPRSAAPVDTAIAQTLSGAITVLTDQRDLAREVAPMPAFAGVNGAVDQQTADAYNRNAAELASQGGYDPGPPKTTQEVQQILDNMLASGQSTFNLDLGLGGSREAGAQSFLGASDAEWEAIMRGSGSPTQPTNEAIAQTLSGAITFLTDQRDLAREVAPMPAFAGVNGAVDQQTADAYNRNAAELASQGGYDPGPPKTTQEVQQILDNMLASGQSTFNLDLGLGGSREAGAQSFLGVSDAEWEAIMNGTAEPSSFLTDSESIALTEQLREELKRRNEILAERSASDQSIQSLQTLSDEMRALLGDFIEGSNTDQGELIGQNVALGLLTISEALNGLLKNGAGQELTADELDALVSQMAREALLEPRLQQDGLGGFVDLPGWIDPNSIDAEEYRKLLDELRREMEETRKILDGKKDKGEESAAKDDSGFGDDENFYENNAFDYARLIGVVPTDLSRWSEWLMTQNVRELERLALLAGYPNLASALADAQNIIRQAEDPGYREWAMQAPSCGGYVGCGPNYLERWWMKQSIVALGDILADSRDIFSTGGFSDIGISTLNLAYLLRDHATEDGDIVRVRITQFGKLIYEGQISLTNMGQLFNLGLGRGVASIEIFAVNEGSLSPNTAQITVDDVVRGQATQTYSLQTGETATLRVEAGAKPGATTSGNSGVGQ